MILSPEAQSAARQALASVRQSAERAEHTADVDAAISELMRTRDQIIRAAITLRAVADEARAKAMQTVEHAA